MRRGLIGKGASGSAAPFLFSNLCACLLWAFSPPGPAAECPATRIDEHVQVVHVYDGDTVKLSDGRRLRLIGINTPEMGRDGSANEPLAEAARSSLQNTLERGDRTLHLQYGVQHYDHYGRLLAHAFLGNGDNVATGLLQQGMATALVVPPNTRAMACYRRLENIARAGRLGLWALKRYQTVDVGALPADTSGFHIVRGRVTAVRESARSTWLDLQGDLALHVSHSDLDNFPPRYLKQLAGHDVEARGWIRRGGNDLRMKIRHPAALARHASGTQP